MKVFTCALLLSIAAVVATRPALLPACKNAVVTETYFSVDRTRSSMCVSTPEQVRAVFENHFKQLNACNVLGLKQERLPETQLYFGPDTIKGEGSVDKIFSDHCRARGKGGLRGLTFVEKESFIVGNTISARWVANAPFLAEPYPGSDAYVTCGDKMLTIVSTFDPSELKFKP